jgi:parvulin-like peptidyl-prolyl isomerase
MIKKTISIAFASMMFMSLVHAESKFGTVNGEEITQLDIDMTMGPSGMKFDTLNPEMKQRVLSMVVDQKLLAQSAMKTDVAKSDEYKKQLETLKKGLVLDVWMKAEMKKIEDGLQKKDIEDAYKKNLDRYKTPMQLKARHILIKSDEKDDEKLKNEAKAKAKALIKELSDAKDKSAKFIDLAKTKSEGPSGPNGGDLGWFSLDRMVPEFSAAANTLKKGEFTQEPVKTQFGYHIIYLDDRKDASVKKLEEVESSLKQELVNEAFGAKIQTLTKELKKDAKIELTK